MVDFAARYAALEESWRALAAADGCDYVPNPAPAGPVDFIFVTQEPSLAVPQLQDWIAAGGRNFLWSQEDFILHWAAQQYLKRPYHITDISKGAMRVKDANRDRGSRWERWWPSLAEEIALVSKPNGTTAIVAVGKTVTAPFLREHRSPLALTILHYSPVAMKSRASAIEGHEQEFEAFAAWLAWERVVNEAVVPAMKEAGLPPSMQNEVIERLPKRLTPSQKKLAFAYQRAFSEAFPS